MELNTGESHSIEKLLFLKDLNVTNGFGIPFGLGPSFDQNHYFGQNNSSEFKFSPPQRPILALGPSRSGKSSCLIVPSIISSLGPVVSTSTKTDIVEATLGTRSLGGKCWIFDPTDNLCSGRLENYVSTGILTPLRWSPTDSSKTWEGALRTAHAIVSSTGRSVLGSDQSHWNERAEALLAPILYASGIKNCGMDEVIGSILTRDLNFATEVITQNSQNSIAEKVLRGLLQTEDRELSGIFSTAAGILSAYRSEKVINSSKNTNFSVKNFVKSGDTLYIASDSDDQSRIAPVVVSLLEEIKTETYKYHAELDGMGLPSNDLRRAPVLFALDEFANCAPLPNISGLIAEGGGRGVLTLACLQDLSQGEARFGKEAEGFLTLFPVKVIFTGVADKKTLESVSLLGGEVDMPTTTLNKPVEQKGRAVSKALNAFGIPSRLGIKSSASISVSFRKEPALPKDQIARGVNGHVLVIVPELNPYYVQSIPWYATSPFKEVVSNSRKMLIQQSGDLAVKDHELLSVKDKADLGLFRSM